MQPATIDPTLDLCTRYPLRLGGPRQCGIQSLPNTSTHGQHWESNPRPSDLTPYPLGHMLAHTHPCCFILVSEQNFWNKGRYKMLLHPRKAKIPKTVVKEER